MAPHGRTSIGIPTGSDGLPTRLEPDQLGTALSVIIGLLSFLPGKKVFTDEVGQAVMVTIWDAAKSGEPLAQIIIDVRATLTRSVEKGPQLDATEKVFDAASCVLKDLEGGAGAARDGDPEKVAESIMEIAKECTGTVLTAGDSAFKEVWQHIKGFLDGAQAVRTVLDGIKLGLTHFGGQIDLRASHTEPVLGNPPNPDYVPHGYGEVRPPVIDNGGDGNGVITDIVWDSWGGPQAHGHGIAPWVPPGAPLAEVSTSQQKSSPLTSERAGAVDVPRRYVVLPAARGHVRSNRRPRQLLLTEIRHSGGPAALGCGQAASSPLVS